MIDLQNIDNLCINCMEEQSGGVCPRCGFDERQYALIQRYLPPRSILNGKYLIGRVLGEGGFGITYIGLDINLQMKVAIKEYYPTGFVTRDGASTCSVVPYTGKQGEFFHKGRIRFEEEARNLAKFRTMPGIVTVSNFFPENGTAYLVMEYLEGETLRSFLQQSGKLPAAKVFEMMKPLMRSLSEVHKAGMIHRDISPDNIMLLPDGSLKLLDFGAAKDFVDNDDKSKSILLKPGYAPEEQYRTRGHQGPWTDVYALCATMYRAITGVTPDESIERAFNDKTLKPSAMGIAIIPHQEAALMKGLAVQHTARCQHVVELWELLFSKPGPSPKPDPDPKPGPDPKPDPDPTPDFKRKTHTPSSKLGRNIIIVSAICAALVLSIPILLPSNQGIEDTTVLVDVTPTPVPTAAPTPTPITIQLVPTIMLLEGPPVMIGSTSVERDSETLSLPYAEMTDSDISELAVLKNLRVVYLYGNQISDLSALSELYNLTKISVWGNTISDLTPLRYLTNLISLDLDKNEVTNINALAGLHNLETLSLWQNQISDIDALAALTKLIHLDLDQNDITDIYALQQLRNLQKLYLWQNNISDISPLTQLTQLTHLTLGENQIVSVDALEPLRQLQELSLADNYVDDITPLANLNQLTHLDFRNNNVTDIRVLQNFTQLQSLNISTNNVRDVKVLSNLTQLETLFMAYTQVNDITPLAGLTQLKKLSLVGNPIQDISILGGLTNLETLYISQTQIDDVSVLANLTKLTVLYLNDTALTQTQVDALQEKLPDCEITF